MRKLPEAYVRPRPRSNLAAVCVAVAGAWMGVALALTWEPAPREPEFEQLGYFKSVGRDRVMTYRLPEGAWSRYHVRRFAEGRMSTDNRMTGVYFYDRGAPAPAAYEVTLAGSVAEAQRALGRPRYAFTRYWGGEVRFADCAAEPDGHPLC